MNDQAARLRSLLGRRTRSIAITSGKGGVGKSNFALNFALDIKRRGFEVIIFDADIGFSNIEVLIGSRPSYNLTHLFDGNKTIWDVIHETREGIKIISGGSGLNEILYLQEDEINYFISQISELNGKVDFILFDTGAGLTKESLKFIAACDETWIITTPEPTSITDAYAIIKMVSHQRMDINFRVIINRVFDIKEGQQTADNLILASQRFLNKEIKFLGSISEDSAVTKAVRRQIPFGLLYPNCNAAKDISLCCSRFLSQPISVQSHTTVKDIFHKMFKWMNVAKGRGGNVD